MTEDKHIDFLMKFIAHQIQQIVMCEKIIEIQKQQLEDYQMIKLRHESIMDSMQKLIDPKLMDKIAEITNTSANQESSCNQCSSWDSSHIEPVEIFEKHPLC